MPSLSSHLFIMSFISKEGGVTLPGCCRYRYISWNWVHQRAPGLSGGAVANQCILNHPTPLRSLKESVW